MTAILLVLQISSVEVRPHPGGSSCYQITDTQQRRGAEATHACTFSLPAHVLLIMLHTLDLFQAFCTRFTSRQTGAN